MRKLVSGTTRVTWLLVGLLALALGVIGVFLPLLPTTPFVLLAAVAFARSSDRLHQWLLDHNVFGTLITDWRHHGAISRTARIASILSMAAVLTISWLLAIPPPVIGIQALVLGACALFVLSRPLPPGA